MYKHAVVDELKILIYVLDDHKPSLENISEAFEHSGITGYTLFTDENQFLEALKKDVRIAVIDYWLRSGKNGVEICKELFKKNPDCFVIMMSAQSDMKPVVDAMNTGVDRYIMKQNPNWLQELIDFTKEGISHVEKEYEFFQTLYKKIESVPHG